jgi:hypothetical protein
MEPDLNLLQLGLFETILNDEQVVKRQDEVVKDGAHVSQLEKETLCGTRSIISYCSVDGRW